MSIKIIFPPDILGGYHSLQQEDGRLLSQSKSLSLFLFLSSPPSSSLSVVPTDSTGFTFNLLISVSQLVFLPPSGSLCGDYTCAGVTSLDASSCFCLLQNSQN